MSDDEDEHQAKRQYIRQWMDDADPRIKAADLIRATGIDKGLVSKWRSNPRHIPHPAGLKKLGDFFKVDPNAFFSHPDAYWLNHFFDGREKVERDHIKKAMEFNWPRKPTA